MSTNNIIILLTTNDLADDEIPNDLYVLCSSDLFP